MSKIIIMSQLEQRKKILEINAMNISSTEKSKLIFQTLNPTKKEIIQVQDICKKPLFCTHYNRYTYQVSKCCNKVYPCRLCHNENEDHLINRHDIDHMKCYYCNCFQKVNASCQNPECYKFNIKHSQFCKQCNLWSNNKDILKNYVNSLLIIDINTSLDTFHCNDCGICRMGKKENYIHCNKCNLCLKKSNYDAHPCRVNLKEENCPICLKEIWNTYNDSPYLLKCGHTIHTSCFIKTLESQNMSCPLCKKSMIDLKNHWNDIDIFLSNQKMPDEYKEWTTDIYCNDCEEKSNTKFHFVYHKCSSCNSYNTIITNVNKINQANVLL